MRASARDELEALEVFRRSTTTLGVVLEGLDIPIQERSATVDIQSAILNLCVLALRSARAAGVVIRSGYEAEALGLIRRVHEARASGPWVAVELPDGRRMMPIAPMRESSIANTMLVGPSRAGRR